MNEQLTLISVTAKGNSFSRTETEKRTTVFCTEKSIGQKEFFAAEAQGLKAEYKLEMWAFEYSGEKFAEYKNQKFSVYRTYKVNDKMEIYLASEG